jgi:hypothetical protein
MVVLTFIALSLWVLIPPFPQPSALSGRSFAREFRCFVNWSQWREVSDPKCGAPVTPELLAWADVIFVMERHHRNKLLKQFRANIKNQKIVVLGHRRLRIHGSALGSIV